MLAAALVAPLLGAGALVSTVVSRQDDRSADDRLAVARDAASALLGSRRTQLREAAQTLSDDADLSRLSGDPAAFGPLAGRFRTLQAVSPGLDALVVTDGAGNVTGATTAPSDFLSGVPSAAALASGAQPGVLVRRVPVPGPGGVATGVLTVGSYLDSAFIDDVAAVVGADVVEFDGSRPLVSTLPVAVTADLDGLLHGVPATVDVGGGGRRCRRARAAADAGGARLVLCLDAPGGRGPGDPGALLGLLVLVLVVVGLLVLFHRWVSSRLASREPARGSEGWPAPWSGATGGTRPAAPAPAPAPARPPSDNHLPVPVVSEEARAADRSVARLAGVYGPGEGVPVPERVHSESEDALVHLGSMLEVANDRDAILSVVTDEACIGLHSRCAVLYLASPSRDRLDVARVSGDCAGLAPAQRLPLGRGLAGWVGQHVAPAVSVTGDHRAGSRAEAVPTSPPEPDCPAVAVPVRAENRLYGVLALYGRSGENSFDDDDVVLLSEFVRQAGVAIDNTILHDEANRLAIRDSLTGVWNRRYFDLVIQSEFERSQRFRHQLSLLMLDLDDFKEVNDTLGHLAGDEILTQIAELVVSQIREVDTFCRYGGEEFTVILPETGRDGGSVAAEKIRRAVEGHVFRASGRDLRITVSIGVASYPDHGAGPAQLIVAADEALYRAKRKGKNRVKSAKGPK